MRLKLFLLIAVCTPSLVSAAPVPTTGGPPPLPAKIETRTVVNCNDSVRTTEIPILARFCWSGKKDDIMEFCRDQLPIDENKDTKRQLPNSFIPEDIVVLPEAAGLLECKTCISQSPDVDLDSTSRCQFVLKNLYTANSPLGKEGYPVPDFLKIKDWRIPPTKFRYNDDFDPPSLNEEYVTTFTYGGRTYEYPEDVINSLFVGTLGLTPEDRNFCFPEISSTDANRVCYFALGTYKVPENTADLTCLAVEEKGFFCPVQTLLPTDFIAPPPRSSDNPDAIINLPK